MKKRKRVWRVLKPIFLIGIGLIIGAMIVEANSSSVVIHHDFDRSEFMLNHESEMQELEIELEQMMRDIEAEIAIPAVPPFPEIPALPHLPEMHSDHVQKIVIEERAHNSSGNYGFQMSEMLGITGGIGLAMVFVMAVVLIFDEIRVRRRTEK